MLEQSPLLVHGWKRSAQHGPAAEAWIRPITDDAARPLGFVRYQLLPALSWFFWLRRVRLDVFETEDASHLMSLTRSWTMLQIWELYDADERHVGSVYPKTLVASAGESLGYLDLESDEQGRIINPGGRALARFCKKNRAAFEMAFAPDLTANPFLRMMMLGCLLTLDPKPQRNSVSER
jgi:hypothetical protein